MERKERGEDMHMHIHTYILVGSEPGVGVQRLESHSSISAGRPLAIYLSYLSAENECKHVS